MATMQKKDNLNLDPITKEPGSHPVGTAVGTVAGIAAGAASAMGMGAVTGSVLGPVGTAVGAAAGGIIGGMSGHALAEGVNPTAEDAYWRENYSTRPYVQRGSSYDLYSPAYRYGVDAFNSFEGRPFDEIEPQLRTNWSNRRDTSTLEWDNAREATRDSYNRLRDRVRAASDTPVF